MLLSAAALAAISLISTVFAGSQAQLDTRQNAPGNGVLTDFQVEAPILTPTGTSNEYGCIYTKTLMQYTFANSYGAPFVGSYTPPPCSFNRVVMNFTVTSQGRQFDRLAIMYLGDTEVWRTSTAEPTSKGIVWTYHKEMQQYNTLWKQPQKIIFDLGNTVNSIYTGPYVTTLTATFFTVPDSPATADQILPISLRQGASGQASVFSIPSQQAITSYTLPNNVERAVVSLAANGQINEEFWYSNTFNSLTQTFDNSTGDLLGSGTWREVQLLIDGQLAGVAWPFPIIFTGGIVPGFWRPIVGIDAFDLREYEIDVTPWLGQLLDGKSHSFEIRVASLDDDGHKHATIDTTAPSYWLVTGKIFLFLGASNARTTGSKPQISAPTPQFQLSYKVTQDKTGANDTLTYTTTARRSLSISSTINTGKGSRFVSWTQNLNYYNYNLLTQQGLVQTTIQSTQGTDSAPSFGYTHSYSYPLNVTTSYLATDTALALNGTISRGEDLTTYGPSVFPSGVQNFNGSAISTSGLPFNITLGGGNTHPSVHLVSLNAKQGTFSGSSLSTSQEASAQFFSSNANSYSFGTTTQDFRLEGFTSGGGGSVELYTRDVQSVNNSITYDRQVLAGQGFEAVPVNVQSEQGQVVLAEGRNLRRIIGRGPSA